MHVGTCNIGDPAEEVAEGIIKVVEEIQTRLPDAHIILLVSENEFFLDFFQTFLPMLSEFNGHLVFCGQELLPRGQMPNPLREKNEKANEYVRQKLWLKQNIEIVPASKTLIQADGSISHHDMPDYISLTEAGYRKIFEPIYDKYFL